MHALLHPGQLLAAVQQVQIGLHYHLERHDLGEVLGRERNLAVLARLYALFGGRRRTGASLPVLSARWLVAVVCDMAYVELDGAFRDGETCM